MTDNTMNAAVDALTEQHLRESSPPERYKNRVALTKYINDTANRRNYQGTISRISAIEVNWHGGAPGGLKLEMYDIPLVFHTVEEPENFKVYTVVGPDRVHPPYVVPWERPQPPPPPSGVASVGPPVWGNPEWYGNGPGNTVLVGATTLHLGPDGVERRLWFVEPSPWGRFWMSQAQIMAAYNGNVKGYAAGA